MIRCLAAFWRPALPEKLFLTLELLEGLSLSCALMTSRISVKPMKGVSLHDDYRHHENRSFTGSTTSERRHRLSGSTLRPAAFGRASLEGANAPARFQRAAFMPKIRLFRHAGRGPHRALVAQRPERGLLDVECMDENAGAGQKAGYGIHSWWRLLFRRSS